MLMRIIRQRGETDCGVACLAMLVGVPWAEARNILFDPRRKKSFYTDTDIMRAALRHFGVITSKRLVKCKKPERLKRDALLKTNVLAKR